MDHGPRPLQNSSYSHRRDSEAGQPGDSIGCEHKLAIHSAVTVAGSIVFYIIHASSCIKQQMLQSAVINDDKIVVRVADGVAECHGGNRITTTTPTRHKGLLLPQHYGGGSVSAQHYNGVMCALHSITDIQTRLLVRPKTIALLCRPVLAAGVSGELYAAHACKIYYAHGLNAEFFNKYLLCSAFSYLYFTYLIIHFLLSTDLIIWFL